MANVNLDTTIANITAATTVMDGATKLVSSIPALLEKARTDALALGATEAELQPLADLNAAFKAKADELAQAVITNTPADTPADTHADTPEFRASRGAKAKH